MVGEARCSVPVTIGLGGGIRQVAGCSRVPTEDVEGEALCRLHADEKRYQLREFRRLMDTATRHSRSVSVYGKGVHCLCGEFVPNGADHPWGLPAKEEDALRLAVSADDGPSHSVQHRDAASTDPATG